MATASIRIDQAAHPTTPRGVAGRSRNDIVLASVVQLANHDDTGVRSWRWEILDQPDRATPDQLSNPTSAAPTFTPNTAGTYRVRLTVNEGHGGQVDTRTVVILDANGQRCPAAGERNESNWIDPDTGLPNDRGWATDMDGKIAAGGGGGGSGWVSMQAFDYEAAPTSTVGANFTVDGITHTLYQAGQSANTRNVTGSGNGMHIEAAAFGLFTADYFQAQMDAAAYVVKLEDIGAFLQTDEICLCAEMTHANDFGEAWHDYGLSSVGIASLARSGAPATFQQPFATVYRGEDGSGHMVGSRNGLENNGGTDLVLREAGISDQGRMSVRIQWENGKITAYVGGPRSGGAWPAWTRRIGGFSMIENTAGQSIRPDGSQQLAVFFAAETGNSAGPRVITETDVHYAEIFRRSNSLP